MAEEDEDGNLGQAPHRIRAPRIAMVRPKLRAAGAVATLMLVISDTCSTAGDTAHAISDAALHRTRVTPRSGDVIGVTKSSATAATERNLVRNPNFEHVTSG
eukprot:SAG31_NODE_20033_length_585_cov_1.271605_1_plen_101_part_10